METLGVKIDIEKDLVPLLEKMSAYDQKINPNITFTERKSEDYFRKHHYLKK